MLRVPRKWCCALRHKWKIHRGGDGFLPGYSFAGQRKIPTLCVWQASLPNFEWGMRPGLCARGAQSPLFWFYYSILGGVCKVKYSADAECEIISLWEIVKYLTSFDVKWNSPFIFAKQIFHSGAISLGGAKFHSPQANFVEKREQVFRLALFFLA